MRFITTCMGRLEHAKKAVRSLLPQPDSGIVFVDWGCPDNSGNWMINLQREQPDKSIIVLQAPWAKNFNLSGARNLGARSGALAKDDVLCFVDCDIVASASLSAEISRRIEPGVFLTFQPRGLPTDGTCVVRRGDFERVGGYDENFRSYGHEDADFYDALRFAGLKERHLPVSLVEHVDHEPDKERYEMRLNSCENQMYRRTKWELARRLGKPLSGEERTSLYGSLVQRYQRLDRPEPDVPPASPKVSFCTACKGREWQLRATYKKNIEDNLCYGNVEFVLLNYDSPGDIDELVRDELKEYIDRGVLKYYALKTPDNATPWHCSVAKNVTHRLAMGDIVCNLDADNMTKPNFATLLAKTCRPGVALRAQGQKGAGGMIAMWRKDFLSVGGYDESFLAVGHQDNDMEDRLWAAGLEVALFRSMPNTVIPNTNVDRMRFAGGGQYFAMSEENRRRKEKNKQLGRVAVNEFGFKPVELLLNFDKEVTLDASNPDLVTTISDVNPLYKSFAWSKPFDEEPSGCWYVVHKDWRDPLFLKPDGDFYRPSKDDGKWSHVGNRLHVLWDNWAPETLGVSGDDVIRGRNMRAMRLGNWKPGGSPRRLLGPEAWKDVFEPWRGKKAAYLQMYGNVGDQMIYDATLQLMSHYGISYERWHDDCDVDVLMITGGGNLGEEGQAKRRKKVIDWAIKKGVKCVILPQTMIRKGNETFAKEVDVYAREDATRAIVDGSRFAPDMALGYRADLELPEPVFDKGYFCSRRTHRFVHACDPTRLCDTPQGYVALAALFKEIVTNRLHFAIAGLIAGRKVTLFPNEYHKNKAVWEASLRHLGCEWRDDMVPEEEIPEDDVVAQLSFFICYGKRTPLANLTDPIDVYVFGTQRSGNHGIIKWLLGQFKHLNPDDNLRKEGIFRNDWNNGGHNENFVPDDSRIPRKDNVRLISYENDWNVLDPERRDMLLRDDPHVRKRCFVVLRSPLNWFASTTRWSKRTPKDKIVELMIRYFEDFYLEPKDPRVIPILFDRWFVDKEYRMKIAREIVDDPNDRAFGTMDAFSTPSSFDGWGHRFDAKALKVLERYKQLSKEDMEALLANPRIMRILEALGDVP